MPIQKKWSGAGEQIAYTYDSLNRLASATSSVNPGWGQSYTYDGFGNMTNQTVTKGTAPALSVTYDPATNRQTGECADANGNLNSAPTCSSSQAMYYDVENRAVRSAGYQPWAYSYAPGNKRVWRGVWDANSGQQTIDEVTFWGGNGQKLTTYSLSIFNGQFVATPTGSNYYFGGKLIKNTTGWVSQDRLGSIGKYFPYGQERPSATTDGKEKFATYFRDSETGLDYADQRYHQPGMGRFMTPDPSRGSINPRDPGSWNKYAYVGGDPVNSNDPNGLYAVPVAPGDEAGYCWENPQDPDCWPVGGTTGSPGPASNGLSPTALQAFSVLQQLANAGILSWYTGNDAEDWYVLGFQRQQDETDYSPAISLNYQQLMFLAPLRLSTQIAILDCMSRGLFKADTQYRGEIQVAEVDAEQSKDRALANYGIAFATAIARRNIGGALAAIAAYSREIARIGAQLQARIDAANKKMEEAARKVNEDCIRTLGSAY